MRLLGNVQADKVADEMMRVALFSVLNAKKSNIVMSLILFLP
jgi:hypothetical protein